MKSREKLEYFGERQRGTNDEISACYIVVCMIFCTAKCFPLGIRRNSSCSTVISLDSGVRVPIDAGFRA